MSQRHTEYEVWCTYSMFGQVWFCRGTATATQRAQRAQRAQQSQSGGPEAPEAGSAECGVRSAGNEMNQYGIHNTRYTIYIQ